MTHVAVAHPSPDLYGSDRQLLESITAIVERGGTVDLVLPSDGPLLPLARARGAHVLVASFPVLRKSLLHPLRLPGLLWRSATATVRATRWLRRVRPDVLYVNTVTIPVWALAGRLAGVPVLAHVHEAEDGGRLVAAGLAAPLLLARRVVANSAAAAAVLVGALPRLAARIEVVHNGVPAPPAPPADASHVAGTPWRLAVVGRLSPRKGTDVAVEAVALLAAEGLDVHLSVAGTPFEGYEWFVDELRERAGRPDLAGRVDLLGYVHPTWDLLAASDVVLVPSRVEPFGNTAVEALLARRPVVASRTQGLAEVVRDGDTGLLVPPDDPRALAEAVATLLRDDGLRASLARAGEDDAHDRFSTARYAQRLLRVLDEVTG
ncbi:glycosyl transferase [Cellulomonas chitinilytica]|uniref:Glycosyl transferase n=1 Tax=Cellulomonas chitinilytica TaxID=398759 RepID=A0A919P222_9CELL|nr:glycosyltransferase family 4 protein [Cellulomonas chitinilytica]GIG19679.1 glycosyl transferase [Cellulomonas chitinilytica]